MHSLSLRVFTDIGAGASSKRGACAEAIGSRRQPVVGSRDVPRSCRIVSCSSSPERNVSSGGESQSSRSRQSSVSSSNPRSFLSRNQTYALLKQQMEVAAKDEDYEEAARLRDSLKLFEEEEPVLQLRRLMKEAVAEERFEDAAKYRNELKDIAPHSLLRCSSDATTSGVRVQVKSVYIENRSQPTKGQYFFAYRIRITNNSDRPVQLLRRHWIITDANGRTENVWGTGVIGEQPVILPRTGFEYSSACPLTTPSGRMEGEFEMKHVDRVKAPTFNVAIAPFSLSTLGDDSDAF
ncbi:uncharacterized protein LOC116215829 [Punica granatum]|uniref:Uncharacterized protein LOC116215829 n=2 Tax=Punica granatum TaxID=22663 RepID=A0A218Y0D6_PUNGR|nr:uncharacterized protein LOC116215829 [Punica granatum]OWM90500.1 hypothetical protein CDL15_Pgr014803 [Punica granatum]